jgi:hypothetical protein
MSQTAVLDHILQNATGAPREAAKVELLHAIKDFCSRSGVWVETVTFQVTEGGDPYTIPMPAGSSVAQIDMAYMGDQQLTPVSMHGRPLQRLGPYYTFHYGPETIELADPVVGQTVTLRVWAQPLTLDDTPAFIYDKYPLAITSEALSRMMLSPDRPYTNPALAAVHHRRFVREVTLAKRAALGGNSRVNVGWRFPHDTRSQSLRR